jgi:hypothetical protein
MPEPSNVRVLPEPAERPKAPVRIESRTVDLIRSLIDYTDVHSTAPYSTAEVAALLPPPDLFRSGMPALYELCWKTPLGDPFRNCDRIAYHDGPHIWECAQ